MTPIAKIEIAIPIPIFMRNWDRDPDLNLKKLLRSDRDLSSTIARSFRWSFCSQTCGIIGNHGKVVMMSWNNLLFLIKQALGLFFNIQDMKNIISPLYFNEFTLSLVFNKDRAIARSRLRSPCNLFYKWWSAITSRSRKKDRRSDRAIGDRSCLENVHKWRKAYK